MNLSSHRLQLEVEGPVKSAREETKGLELSQEPHPWVLFVFEALGGAFTPCKGGCRDFLALKKEFPEKEHLSL